MKKEIKKVFGSKIGKPENLEKYDLIAVIPYGANPKRDLDPINPEYMKNEIAINVKNRDIQVYVTSHTKNGIARFREDYPEARTLKKSESGDDWVQLVYPEKGFPEDLSPLDNFFRGYLEESLENGLQ